MASAGSRGGIVQWPGSERTKALPQVIEAPSEVGVICLSSASSPGITFGHSTTLAYLCRKLTNQFPLCSVYEEPGATAARWKVGGKLRMTLTIRDVAALLKVSERTIYRWIDLEVIPAYRINEQWRFNRAELLAWATARRLNVSSELLQEPETVGSPAPSLAEILSAGGVFYRVAGRDKASALMAVVELSQLPEEVDRSWVFEMLLARESLESTAIGEGIAIPHVRYPIALHTPKPLLMLCFLENPVEFGALDGQPVRVLFCLLSPTIRGHLALLSRLAFVLRDPRFKDAVLREASREEIFQEARRVESGFVTAPATIIAA